MPAPATPEAHIDVLQATEDLIAAETTEQIADIAVEATANVLQMSHAGVHLYDEAEHALVPVAWTESIEAVIDEPPSLGAGSLAWDVYHDGEMAVYEDLDSVADAYNPETPFRSEIIVPLAEHGVLLVSFTNTATIDDADRRLVDILGANVTEALDRVDRERSLRTFKRAVEHTGHAVVVTDTDGTIRYVNPAFEAVTGYDAESAIGRTPRILKSGEHDAAFYENLWDTITSGEVWRNTLINSRKDGETFVVNQTIAPVFDDEGSIERFVAVNHDITDLKRREQNLELLNQVLRHDVRNDLQLVLGHASRLKQRCDDADEDIEMVVESAQHAVDLTRTARNLANLMLGEETTTEPVSLRTALESELDAVRSSSPDVSFSVDGTLPDVTVQAGEMLESVFRNLLKNAIQHNDKAVPEITITASEAGDTAVVRIADNGPGIPDAQKGDIFGQGEKGLESQGTGLGLYLVRSLVEAYGGSVRAEDNDPEGTVFVVELPTV